MESYTRSGVESSKASDAAWEQMKSLKSKIHYYAQKQSDGHACASMEYRVLDQIRRQLRDHPVCHQVRWQVFEQVWRQVLYVYGK